MMPVRSSAASSRCTVFGLALALVALAATGRAQSSPFETFPVPAQLTAFSGGARVPGIFPASPADVATLRPLLSAELGGLPPAARAAAVQASQLFRLQQGIAAKLGGNCDPQGNCPILFFLQAPDSAYHVALRGSGNAIGSLTSTQPPYSRALVISRKTPAGAEELVRYRPMPPLPLAGSPATGACSQANGIVNGAVRCVTWVTDACEFVAGSKLTPVYCANTQPIVAAVRKVDETKIDDVAQDGSGTVWGQTNQALLEWSGNGWQAVPPPQPGMMPRYGLFAGPWRAADGGIELIWSPTGVFGNTAPGLLTWQRGDSVQSVPLPKPNDVWAALPTSGRWPLLVVGQAGADSVLKSISPSAGLKTVYHFSQPQFTAPPVKNSSFQVPMHATQDGHGATWIWMPALTPATAMRYQVPVLKGFLIDRDGRFEYRVTLPGLPAQGLSTLAPWDHSHLLAGVMGRGPFLIDINSLQASPLPVPSIGDLRNIRQVASQGGDRYLIAATAAEPTVIAGTSERRQNDLWRWHDGRWQLLVAGLDPANDFRLPSPRTVVTARGGVWMGTGDGVWYVPKGSDSPTLLGASQGLPVSEVDGLYRLSNDRLLAVEAGTETATVSPASLLESHASPASFKALPPGEVFEPGPDHHLWALSQNSLSEWNGSQWLNHPVPGELSGYPFSGVMPDTHGEIWLLPGRCRFGPVGVFNAKTKNWRIVADYRFALVHAGYSVQAVQEHYNLQPFDGPGGQIAFKGICGALNYTAGQGWRMWRQEQMPAGHQYALQSPPFYSANGALTIDLDNQTWEWTGNDWQQVTYQPRPSFRTLPPPLTTAPPANCPTTWPSSLVTDRLGRQWWTADGNLYVGTQQACRVVLSAAQPQPFRDGRKLNAVYIGPNGQDFLDTEGPSLRQFVQIAAVPALTQADPRP